MPHPYIPVPGVLQANVRFLLEGQQIESVLNFRYEGTPFEEAANTVWNLLDVSWWQPMRPNLSVDITNVETYVVDLSSEAGPVAAFPSFVTPGGGATGSPVPNNAALCITHRTANRGRSYRGRTFVPAIAKSIVNGSFVQADSVAAFVAAFNEMRTTASTAGIPFTIVSRYHNKAPRVTGIDTVVTQCVARDNVLDSQRRRTPGRGT